MSVVRTGDTGELHEDTVAVVAEVRTEWLWWGQCDCTSRNRVTMMGTGWP